MDNNEEKVDNSHENISVSQKKVNEATSKNPPPNKKYAKQVNAVVTEINSELNKILSSSSTFRNIDEIEQDLSLLSKKIPEVKKALQAKQKEPKLHSQHSAKINKAFDRLIEISMRHDISDEDQAEILKELKTNFGGAGNVISLIKKALSKPDNVDGFNLGG